MQFHQNLAGLLRALKKRTLLSGSLILFLVFNLSGCGPKVTTCLSDTAQWGFQCFNQKTNKAAFVLYSDSENYVAMKSKEYDELISCQATKVLICISDPASEGFDCTDERTQESSFLPYSLSDNFIAMPPLDYDQLLRFLKEHCHD